MTQIAVPYFCARPRAASSAGVLLFMEGNGMSPQLLRVAQRLAGEGYHVVAPDVFHRFGGSDPERSMAEGALETGRKDFARLLREIATLQARRESSGEEPLQLPKYVNAA